MHIVTFYSYKGGVGRTMALVNAAVELAHRKKNVLIVDFDLEAPGISTYALCSSATNSPGIVEYITRFIESGNAPNVREFIQPCELGESRVWVMPAGQRDEEYSARLNSIDWQSLYAFQSGYLMFEDLKQQWQNLSQRFDYVLIDSRTGHTDVGGICTRHLPNAVILMFFPNDQNVMGLEIVANEIRHEPSKKDDQIIVHFCASNVPDLDDEEHILERKLHDAKRRLNYEGEPILIHHYNSLALLEQAIFVETRPSSKLAAEYRALVDQIISKNLEDTDGALAVLNELRENLRQRRGMDIDLPDLEDQLAKIRQLHVKDGEVNWSMAAVYGIMGDLESEAECLTTAIDQDVRAIIARRRRAAIARIQGRREDALEDLSVILRSTDAPAYEQIAAMELLREIDEEWVSVIDSSTVVGAFEHEHIIRVVDLLMSDRRGLALAERLVREKIRQGDKSTWATRLILILIGSRQFSSAMLELGNDRHAILESESMVVTFNYAMAEWGLTKNPPLDLMQRVLGLAETEGYRDINTYQCLALAAHVCSDTPRARRELRQARRKLELFRGRAFSCWRYLEVNRSQMTRDLNELEQMLRCEDRVPPVFLGHEQSDERGLSRRDNPIKPS